jgi:hypothetical protein
VYDKLAVPVVARNGMIGADFWSWTSICQAYPVVSKQKAQKKGILLVKKQHWATISPCERGQLS